MVYNLQLLYKIKMKVNFNSVEFSSNSYNSCADYIYFQINPKIDKVFCEDVELNEVYVRKEFRHQKKTLFDILKKLSINSNGESGFYVLRNKTDNSYYASSAISMNDVEDIDEKDIMLLSIGIKHSGGTHHDIYNIINLVYTLHKLNIQFKFNEIEKVYNNSRFKYNLQVSLHVDDCVNQDVCNMEQNQIIKSEIEIQNTIKIKYLTSENLLDECVQYVRTNALYIMYDIIETIKVMLSSKEYVLSDDFKKNKLNLKDTEFKFRMLTQPESITKKEILAEVFDIDNSVSLI